MLTIKYQYKQSHYGIKSPIWEKYGGWVFSRFEIDFQSPHLSIIPHINSNFVTSDL